MENNNDIFNKQNGYPNFSQSPNGYQPQNPAQPTGYQNPTPPKNGGNKKPIILISAIVAIVVVAVVVVCMFTFGGDSNISNRYYKNGVIDIKEITLTGISVNGKNISLPCKVNDLGNDWRIVDEDEHKITTKDEFESKIEDLELSGEILENYRKSTLPQGRVTNGEQTIVVYFCEYSNTGYDDIPICGIFGFADCLDICGLSQSNNITRDMKKQFAEPDETVNYSDSLLYRYFPAKESIHTARMDLYISDDDKLLKSRILYFPEQIEVSATEPTESSEVGVARVNISEIAKNIEIDGKKISLPCTIGELKAQGFECDDTLTPQGSKIIEDKVFSKDGEIYFNAMFDSYDYQKDLDDNMVTGIRILNVLLLDSVKFADITKDTSRQDFLNSFDGNVKEISTDSNYYSYFYTIYDINNDESYLSVVFSMDGIQGITIHI